MKTLKVVTSAALVALAMVALSGPASAYAAVTDQMKLDCFTAHQQMMDKPAVKNVDACWQAHGYQVLK
jgi:hypothetical protein